MKIDTSPAATRNLYTALIFSEALHHVPTLLIEFEPVPALQPNDSKGWRDRDALAALLASAGE